ncbi:MAG TPA: ATP-binding protein [Syntrophales bacterium]|nr:ATP-binding protein [Syntrophales bacterium]
MKKRNKSVKAKSKPISKKAATKDNLMKHIYEISCLLAGSPNFDVVLEEIVDRVMSGLHFDRAAILLLNEDESRLDCLCVKGFSSEGEKRAKERPIKLSKHECYEKKVIESGEPLFIKDLGNNPSETRVDKLINKYQERKSVLYVPLKLKKKVFGMIGVDRYKTKMKITRNDVESLAIFANQASIVIESARSYKALYDEKKLSENIIMSSVNGIIVSDFSGNIQIINSKVEEIFGMHIKDIKRLRLQDLIVVDDSTKKRTIGAWRRQERDSNLELNYVRNDGKPIILDIKFFPLSDSSGNTHSLVTIVSDITEKKKLDDYLLRLEKFAALGAMASGIAHEIRNPLTSIYAIVQYLENDNNADFKIDGCKSIKNEIDRIEKLIRQMLDLSRPSPLQIRKSNVRDLLLSTVKLVARQASQKGISIRTEFEESETMLNIDPDRMRQVFLNLIINAIDAINQRGEITIDTRLTMGGLEEWYLIEIKDNGNGIPTNILNRIFDPFFTTKNVGTGLGLTVSHKIIQDHGGSIEVFSNEKNGTTFQIKLPAGQEGLLKV